MDKKEMVELIAVRGKLIFSDLSTECLACINGITSVVY